jgi:hypothetical protein
MRHTTRSILSAVIVLWCCCQTTWGQEAESRWWPFGRKQEATTAPPAATTKPSPAMPAFATPSPSPALPPSSAITPVGPQTATAQTAPLTPPSTQALLAQQLPPEETPMFTWPTMPEFSLPKPRMPQLWSPKPAVDDTRNAWAGQSADPQRPSPLQAMRDGAKRVGDSTKSAWRKTVDTLTPGDSAANPTPPQVASGNVKPPFWKRMFAAEEAPEEGPRTMSEWVAQERLDP